MLSRRAFLMASGLAAESPFINGGNSVMTMEKTTMYESWNIGEMSLKNRLVASAIFEFAANDGRITEEIIHLYQKLAKGGVGLIITGMEAISSTAGLGPIMVNAAYDNYEDDMKKIVNVIHENGAKVFVQLQHAGYRTGWKFGGDTFGVCKKDVSPECTYHEATQEELRKVIDDFGKAAARCKAAGCDGVQIHSAHGFLLNSFLSPYFNHRTDNYGGNIENRARLLLEVYEAIRAQVGDNYLISVKIPFSDLTEPSITPDDCVWICKELEKRGLNMIEITAGISYDGGIASFTPFANIGNPEGKFLEGAEFVSDNVNIPVVSVCGYRSPNFIEKTLSKKKVSAISLGRPLIREPDLPTRWIYDKTKAKCISCNRCYGSKNIISCIFDNS